MSSDNQVKVTQSYYDSHDADEFYHRIWGGEDIHIGIYEWPDEPIFQASKRTIQTMVSFLAPITSKMRILDLGSGYGGAARYLASRFNCSVDCLNLSIIENDRNIAKNKLVGLQDQIIVKVGNFETPPYEANTFDIIWSEDAFLHSGQKEKIFEEAHRLLRPGGQFIFTDPMQADDCPPSVLQPILDRIHLKELGSIKRYREIAARTGFKEQYIKEMPEQLTLHYTKVRQELCRKQKQLSGTISPAYIERMKKGLQHWIEGGQKGYLNWGILHFSVS